MKKTLVVVVALVAAIIVGILFKEFGAASTNGGGFNRGDQAALVEVEEATMRDIELRAEAVGTTYAKESVEITANVTETIESIHFKDGDRVKKGDVLVVLTNNEEQAQLLSAQANLNEQQREVKRLEGLAKTNAVSQSMLDERRTMAETAQHQVDVVEARLRDRIIRAPFSGVLGLRQISPGSLIGPGTVITTLDDLEFMKLDFAVPEIYLTAVTPGIEVEARSPALPNKPFNGKIVSVDSRINQVDRSIKVRAEIPNPDAVIKPGMLMHVEVLIENRNALTVPESAIFIRGNQHYVFTVKSQNPPVAQLKEVEIGVRKPGLIEIVGGLSAGETVVSKGAAIVSEGMPLNIAGREG